MLHWARILIQTNSFAASVNITQWSTFGGVVLFAKTKIFQFTFVKFWIIFVKTRKTPRACTNLPRSVIYPHPYLHSIMAQISSLCDYRTNEHPYKKNYKFTISQAKPTMVNLLPQHLWQLPVYVNTNKNTVSAFAHHTYYDKSDTHYDKSYMWVIFTDTFTANMN